MGTDFFVSWQFGVTLLLVLAIGVWQLMSVRRSQARRGEEAGDAKITEPTITKGPI